MTSAELDPRLTFESFVVGPANRLASAAARRAADSPGTSYNPLFLYSEGGLGKTHLLVATAHRSRSIDSDLRVAYVAMDRFLDQLQKAQEAGKEGALADRLKDADVLLLDDVQRLSGNALAQEFIHQALVALGESGGQVVLASNCAPSEIPDLDSRVVARFSGGLIVDIAAPEYDTRVAIVRKKIGERGGELAEGVAELLARFPIRSVKELGGVINRVLAIQDLEGRKILPDEVPNLVSGLELGSGDEFGSFVDEISQDVATTVEFTEAPWRKDVRETVSKAETDGFNPDRMRRFLEQEATPREAKRVADQFKADCQRLKAIRQELTELGNPWPEASLGVLRDPDRLEEAESLVASARELTRPFPNPPANPRMEELADHVSDEVLRSAERLLAPDGGSYNPLFLWSPGGAGSRAVLTALAHSFRDRSSKGRVAYVAAPAFAEDFIRALSAGVAGAWRERWWRVELLLIHGIHDVASTERAQDELVHLIEAIQRNGGRIAFSADRPPTRLGNTDTRLLSLFEAGLVVDVGTDDLPLIDNLLADADLGLPGQAGAEGGFDDMLGPNLLEVDLGDLSDVLTPVDAATLDSAIESLSSGPSTGTTIDDVGAPDPTPVPEADQPPAVAADEVNAEVGGKDPFADGPADPTGSMGDWTSIPSPEEPDPFFSPDGSDEFRQPASAPLEEPQAASAPTPTGAVKSVSNGRPERAARRLPDDWTPSSEELVLAWPDPEDLMVWEGVE